MNRFKWKLPFLPNYQDPIKFEKMMMQMKFLDEQ